MKLHWTSTPCGQQDRWLYTWTVESTFTVFIITADQCLNGSFCCMFLLLPISHDTPSGKTSCSLWASRRCYRWSPMLMGYSIWVTTTKIHKFRSFCMIITALTVQQFLLSNVKSWTTKSFVKHLIEEQTWQFWLKMSWLSSVLLLYPIGWSGVVHERNLSQVFLLKLILKLKLMRKKKYCLPKKHSSLQWGVAPSPA